MRCRAPSGEPVTVAAAEAQGVPMSVNPEEAVPPAPARSGPRAGTAARAGAAVVIGAAVGVLTSFAQAWLPAPWSALANSASPWLAGGFAAGALQAPRGAAVAAGLSACV